MAFAQRIMASGASPMLANNIVGDVTQGIAATGSTQLDAYQASTVGTEVAVTAAGTGVVGLPGNPGDLQWVYNGGANALTWYPPGTDTVNNGATSFSISANTGNYFIKRNNTAWATK